MFAEITCGERVLCTPRHASRPNIYGPWLAIRPSALRASTFPSAMSPGLAYGPRSPRLVSTSPSLAPLCTQFVLICFPRPFALHPISAPSLTRSPRCLHTWRASAARLVTIFSGANFLSQLVLRSHNSVNRSHKKPRQGLCCHARRHVFRRH